jgi:hypothetical protein
MRLNSVVWVDHARDATLRVIRIRFGALLFGDDKDFQARFERKLDGKEESGAAGAKN